MKPIAILLLCLLAACSARRGPAPPEPDPVTVQQERAAVRGRDQVLELARLASVAMAHGELDIAEEALRRAVSRMQDFRADGELRAMVGAERAKEWKGEPYEKMMAFLYLGALLYQKGQYGNALAMSKAAILADTGTRTDPYHADFVPAWVLQGLAYEALGERRNAERAIDQAIDLLWARALADRLAETLHEVHLEGGGGSDEDAARMLLLGGLPAALQAHPRDPERAIDGALSWATDTRQIALKLRPSRWPSALTGLRKSDLRRAFDRLEPLAAAWRAAELQLPAEALADLEDQERFLHGLREDPGLLLWVESGVGPQKVATGRYGQLLQLRARQPGARPQVRLNGQPLRPRYLDSVTWQAQTRGGRGVDAFLKGKAVFKDSSLILGSVLLDLGNAFRYSSRDERSTTGDVLAAAGGITWLVGAFTNPRADTRQWELLPDALWLVRADPPPGEHQLTVGARTYTVSIPDSGGVVAWLPALPPGGPAAFGAPCQRCESPESRRDTEPMPLAIPQGDVP